MSAGQQQTRGVDPDAQGRLIRASTLAPVIEELDRRRISGVDAMLARFSLTRARLADPYAELPLAGYVALLEHAAVATEDPLLGARVGSQFRPAHLGPVGLLFGASSTLRRGLMRLARWVGAWQDGVVMRVAEEDDVVVWSYRLGDHTLWPRRQDSEYTLTATVALAREAFGSSGRPIEAHLEHAEPDDPTPLSRALGLKPMFGQPTNGLVFSVAEADRVHRAEDRDLMTILERHVADLVQPEQGEDGLLARARTLVRAHLGRRRVTVPSMAAELNVSSRTLQRRLAEEGTSLRALVLQCRLELGRMHLRDGRISNAEIARVLGYADSTAFWRAFKAGVGSTPSQHRREATAAAGSAPPSV